MADIKLGLTGAEVTLPTGVHYEIPVDPQKDVAESVMSDGTRRYGFYKMPRRWTLKWVVPLALTNIQILVGLRDLNSVLHFQNQWESNTWYNVVITGFSYWSAQVGPVGGEKYLATMSLKEAV